MRQLRFGLILGWFAAALATTAGAQQDPNQQSCDPPDKNVGITISACTRIIERGDLEPLGSRAMAYNNRCAAHVVLRNLERAASDCAEAIRMDPSLINSTALRSLADLQLSKQQERERIKAFQERLRAAGPNVNASWELDPSRVKPLASESEATEVGYPAYSRRQ